MWPNLWTTNTAYIKINQGVEVNMGPVLFWIWTLIFHQLDRHGKRKPWWIAVTLTDLCFSSEIIIASGKYNCIYTCLLLFSISCNLGYILLPCVPHASQHAQHIIIDHTIYAVISIIHDFHCVSVCSGLSLSQVATLPSGVKLVDGRRGCRPMLDAPIARYP